MCQEYIFQRGFRPRAFQTHLEIVSWVDEIKGKARTLKNENVIYSPNIVKDPKSLNHPQFLATLEKDRGSVTG
jgi:hypothetical protein